MQFLIFVVALIVNFLFPLVVCGSIVLLSSPAFGKVDIRGWRKIVVINAACPLILVGGAYFGIAGLLGTLLGAIAYRYFYKRFLRTR